jgi:hypothetical protein
MTTREKLKGIKTKFLSVYLLMALSFAGITLQSPFLIFGGLIAAIFFSHVLAQQMKCPLCRSSLIHDSRRNTELNFCPGCARSIDDEE